jgi:hypothetical protein
VNIFVSCLYLVESYIHGDGGKEQLTMTRVYLRDLN